MLLVLSYSVVASAFIPPDESTVDFLRRCLRNGPPWGVFTLSGFLSLIRHCSNRYILPHHLSVVPWQMCYVVRSLLLSFGSFGSPIVTREFWCRRRAHSQFNTNAIFSLLVRHLLVVTVCDLFLSLAATSFLDRTRSFCKGICRITSSTATYNNTTTKVQLGVHEWNESTYTNTTTNAMLQIRRRNN